jgi:hypothetical protein
MMICPRCRFEQPDGSIECQRCGIIFEKYQLRQNQSSEEAAAPILSEQPPITQSVKADLVNLFKDLLFHLGPDENGFYLGGRVVVLLVIMVWGLKLIFSTFESNYAGQTFLHMINLPFHEAGHILFSPFGRLMQSLGGSLMQLLVPLICLMAFLIQTRDPFAGSVALWWFGENLIDLAPYINDALALKLTLIGGFTGRELEYGFHDWEFILQEMGWLRYSHVLATTAHALGALVMLLAASWGGYLLFKQYKNLGANSF